MIPNKVKLFSAFLILVLALPLMAAPPIDLPIRTRPQTSAQSDVLKYVDVNSLLMFATNYGNFAYDASKLFSRNDGLYFPFSSTADIISGANAKHVIFDAGVWIGAKDSLTDSLLVTVAEYSTEFQVGNMRDSTFIPGADVDPAVRTYTLEKDSLAGNPSADYTNWPVDQGAPLDSLGHPAILGNKMLWSVYNDADPARHGNNAGKTNPLGVEIQQSTFAFKLTGALSNVAFLRYKIKNKGTRVLKNMYVSLWSDPDLGGSADDLVGCDSINHLGYCYNGTNNDAIYGATPPCVGMDFFQGPLQYTGNMSDVGRMWFDTFPGYINLPMSSFNKYINGTDPKQATQTYNFMQGLNADGTVYTFEGTPTKFFNSGDPVTGTGDVDVSPADRRMMLTTGPFTFRPGDSTEVIAAVIVGQGTDRLASIKVMKQFDQSAKIAYKRNFNLPSPPRSPLVKVGNLDGAVSLTWNDTSEVDHGDFPFVGYTVYQGKSINGNMTWKQLANYDDTLTGGNLYDSVPDPNIAGLYYWQVVKYGTKSGLRRFYIAAKDAFTGGPLNNVSDYTFRVDAYSYDITAPTFLAGKILTSQTVVNVTPQKPIAGGHLVVPKANQSLPTTHVTGQADVTVNPVVLDPTLSMTDQYRLTFVIHPDTTITDNPAGYDTTFNYITTSNICFILPPNFDTVMCVDTTIERIDTTAASVDTSVANNTYWKLEDLTKSTVLFDHKLLSGKPDSTLKIFDGIQLRLNGLSGLRPGEPGAPDSGWSVPSGTRRFTQLGGGDGLGLEGFRGAAGWESPYDIFYGIHDILPQNLVNVQLRLAATDTNGVPLDSTDVNYSWAYRYGRHFADAPAKPSFIPFIKNTVGGGVYAFQDFTKSVPLSAWNLEANPPTRLAVGYLENNADSGMVDGKYWPPFYNSGFDNTSGNGPREWLFIFNKPYADTLDPALAVSASESPIGIMYTGTWARRDEDGWTAGDEFDLFHWYPALAADTFLFSGSALTVAKSAAALDQVRAVPNPYYLFSQYDTDVAHRQIRFTNLPQVCSIWIYNLAGDKVAQVDKNSNQSFATWNVQTSNGIPVASGIYIYVVDAPGYGQKTGKLAVFTETEQLKTY